MPGHLSGNWVLWVSRMWAWEQKSHRQWGQNSPKEKAGRKSGEPRGPQRWWRGVLEPVTGAPGPELVGAVSAGHHPGPTHPGTPVAATDH